MIKRCRIAHFDDLNPHQQVQMLEVLTGAHQTQHPESLPQFGLNGGRPVALLKDGKVIAAMVTDENHDVLHWAGRHDREFLKEFRRTPAMELMRVHVARLGDRPLTFHGVEDEGEKFPFGMPEGNLFARRFARHGVMPEFRNNVWRLDLSKLPEAVRKKLEPKITWNDREWRPHRPR